MSAKKNTDAPAPVHFTHEDLVVINNALNEVCNGLSFSDDEFQTRIGVSRQTAQKVLGKVARALRRD